ncbi:MAG: zincin-like metallopeptidase domain-containing protein [Candidatus Delongbacteria bacterium]|jgi:hypothetical protein|nr:zincin-like metallopeptidase domain-containing protein [Candidatus Delongbacteria bacterium]
MNGNLNKIIIINLILIASLFGGNITVMGKFVCYNYNNYLVNGRGAEVYIMDEDFRYDDIIDIVTVDRQGMWGARFDPDMDIFGGHADVYATFEPSLSGTHGRIYVDGGGGLVTPTQDNLNNNYNFGTISVQGADVQLVNAYKIYLGLFEGYNFMKSLDLYSGYTKAKINNSNDRAYYDPNDTYIYIPPEKLKYNYTLLHEMGHSIHHYRRGALPTGDGPSPHYAHSVSSRGFAYKEGFAEFFACFVKNTSKRWWASGSWIDYEPFKSYWPNTEICEGTVTAAMWDLYDSTGDGIDFFYGGTSFFQSLWYRMGPSSGADLHSFWYDYYRDYLSAASKKDALLSMLQSGIDYREESDNLVTIGTSNSIYDYENINDVDVTFLSNKDIYFSGSNSADLTEDLTLNNSTLYFLDNSRIKLKGQYCIKTINGGKMFIDNPEMVLQYSMNDTYNWTYSLEYDMNNNLIGLYGISGNEPIFFKSVKDYTLESGDNFEVSFNQNGIIKILPYTHIKNGSTFKAFIDETVMNIDK